MGGSNAAHLLILSSRGVHTVWMELPFWKGFLYIGTPPTFQTPFPTYLASDQPPGGEAERRCFLAEGSASSALAALAPLRGLFPLDWVWAASPALEVDLAFLPCGAVFAAAAAAQLVETEDESSRFQWPPVAEDESSRFQLPPDPQLESQRLEDWDAPQLEDCTLQACLPRE